MIRHVGIDPSSKTGIVILDHTGAVLVAKDITGVGDKDPQRIATLVDAIIREIEPEDNVCIEGFAFGAQGRGISFQFGLGYMIRDRLYRKRIPYTDVTPPAVKKFATGKGNTKKDEMVLPIFRRWEFEHRSDNVRDAFVLAQIARELEEARRTGYIKKTPIYQHDVIDAIINPKEKPKTNKRRGKPAATGSHTQNTEQTCLF